MTADYPNNTEIGERAEAPGELAKLPLEPDALVDIVNLALMAGQLLMQNGAESQRVEETVRLLGTGLGCDWGDVFVSHNAIVVSYGRGGEFHTKTRRLTSSGVNTSLVAGISHLIHRIEGDKIDRFEARAELERISAAPRLYNRWLTIFAVGLACAAFSRLLGGDWPVFGMAFVSASVAIFVRQELDKRHFNVFLVVIVAALIAGGLVGLLSRLQFSPRPELALTASVLFLVPGVLFINAVEDLIKGYTLVGLARGTTGTLIILAIALGLILAIWLTGLGRP